MLSAFLSSQNDVELARLVDTVQISSVGVGGAAGVIRVYDNRLNGVPVFTKRIPLSVREIAEVGSTSNHFDLPTFCQYGIGGPSFNAWRELAANIVVTDAVLAGETQSFPMLYHWRILPGRSPVAAEHADIDSVHTAGASREVRTRLEALAAAPCSLVLFCEYIEHPISNWLEDNPSAKAAEVERHHARGHARGARRREGQCVARGAPARHPSLDALSPPVRARGAEAVTAVPSTGLVPS